MSNSLTLDVLLESWDRQCRIVMNLVGLINESNRTQRPSEDGWPLDRQIAHVHNCRIGWMHAFSPSHAEGTPYLGVLTEDGLFDLNCTLDEARAALEHSGKLVRAAVKDRIEAGDTRCAPYDHPVFYMQHMLWHDGYHYALMALALRLAGCEPTEEWDERNTWGLWRDPEF